MASPTDGHTPSWRSATIAFVTVLAVAPGLLASAFIADRAITGALPVVPGPTVWAAGLSSLVALLALLASPLFFSPLRVKLEEGAKQQSIGETALSV
eukprot:CAMPEP_0171084672 /NCGR_PEP_ID=MMETSP0766_2-20121228/18460_1 /TAXON_ID=439317 /ORGANISM="Gambierdiscus australes, Strain CAWD 149" /LENGTH=96 /DNA_ID=CAMNT_0011542189 /DNA_START=42 /DNA_END=332 /DNA_ORIENTATION=+